ncbi:hypothetical protein [Methanolobus sp. WCC5]|uniref:hypothetical protein n=1 Tax=Methanolobus sp. WCC5 TaxID=3125785 RepID=UPI003249E01D
MDAEIYTLDVNDQEERVHLEERAIKKEDSLIRLSAGTHAKLADDQFAAPLDNGDNLHSSNEPCSDNVNSQFLATKGSMEIAEDTEDTDHPSDLSYDPIRDVGEGVQCQPDRVASYDSELEGRLLAFEDRLNVIQSRMTEVLDTNEELLYSVKKDIHARADEKEFKQLKRDFDQFSKRLRRVVQAEDSINADSLDATKVPPDVLEITYAKTLNDIYGAMLEIYGDRDSAEMVEDARDSVRQFSAGVDFFRFEDNSFVVRGLSDAIASKIVSVKQIHGTYVELFKMLFQHVPNYNSQDFRSFVETGSREYTIEKVVSHERCIDTIISDIGIFRDELSHITENVSFIAELQNNELEEMGSKFQEIDDIREQMKSIAKAVNLHTRAINKLNKTLTELRELSGAEPKTSELGEVCDITRFEEMVVSKASREEIMAVSGEMEAFKASVEDMLASIQQQLEENMLNSRKPEGIETELAEIQENLHEYTIAEEPQKKRFSDIPIEDVITGQLEILGSATLKQLEKQINENGLSIDFEKLSLVMSYLEQEKIVNAVKKGRYTFYSVTGPEEN